MTEAVQSDIQIHEAEVPETLFKIANPIMKFILISPLHGMVDSQLTLLRWRGRKSGKEYTIPVGYKKDGDEVTLFTFSGWKANFRQPHPVQLKLEGQWRSGTGVINDDPRTIAEFIKRGVSSGDRGGYRRFRMEIEGDREPTVEELIPEVEKRDMVLIKITLEG